MPEDRYRRSNIAIKYLYDEIYKLDKEYNFQFPHTKRYLEPYARRIRGIVEDTIHLGQVVKIKGHNLNWEPETQKKKDEEEGE